MNRNETPSKRKERFKAMPSLQRQTLIKEKMKAQGLEEGSGVKDAAYDKDEVWELIQISSCFPEMKYKYKE